MRFTGLDPLVEVYSVHVFIDGVDDLSSADIEGFFKVSDIDEKYMDFYERVEGSPCVLPDGTLSLSAPSRCLAGPRWGFKLHLKDKRRNLEICKGRWGFMSDHFSLNKGPPLSAVVYGKDGYAIVNYLMYAVASQATIEVFADHTTLEDNRVDATESIHGSIRAQVELHESVRIVDSCFEDLCKITLFHVPQQKPQMLEASENKIALSRSCVVVPRDLDLIVEAKLFQGSTCELADGCASFKAQKSGTTSRKIGGITVKVTWHNDPFEAAGLPHPYP